jgi:transcriptional regulator with XRE-family HTH domain
VNNLKLYRQSINESQWQTAQGIGVTERAYRKIENGECLPSYKSIKGIEQHFKKSIDYLLEQSDDGNPPRA